MHLHMELPKSDWKANRIIVVRSILGYWCRTIPCQSYSTSLITPRSFYEFMTGKIAESLFSRSRSSSITLLSVVDHLLV
jgi:hypothetical protein